MHEKRRSPLRWLWQRSSFWRPIMLPSSAGRHPVGTKLGCALRILTKSRYAVDAHGPHSQKRTTLGSKRNELVHESLAHIVVTRVATGTTA